MKPRVIALYLPQFYPTKENNTYWGNGFTEWNNVVKARPLFPGHYQPRYPADLGFYDLRLSEIRELQAEYAERAGVEGFCYWHYWFGNSVETLERPLDEVVKLGKPDYPFCVGWANHSWTTKTWTKVKMPNKEDAYIFKQEYLGEEDYKKHFYRLLPVFKDRRYIRVDGKLLFVIYDLGAFPSFYHFKVTWNMLAEENGINGFYFVAYTNTLPVIDFSNLKSIRSLDEMLNKTIDSMFEKGADAVNTVNLKYAELKTRGVLYKAIIGALRKKNLGISIEKYDYRKIVKYYNTNRNMERDVIPQILVGNDRSPRAGRNAIVYYNNTPDSFYDGACIALDKVREKEDEYKLVLVNSWNEWGEGSYLEPDQRYGTAYIDALKAAIYR